VSTSVVASRSDAEDIMLSWFALDVGREIVALLGEVPLTMIALARPVIGDIEDTARAVAEVRLRAVRNIAVEKDHVARARRQRRQLEARHVPCRQRLPFRPKHAPPVLSGSDLETAILGGRVVD